MMTNAKTAMSKEACGWFNSGNGGIRKSDEIPTKDKSERHFSRYRGTPNIDETQMVRIQRNRRQYIIS